MEDVEGSKPGQRLRSASQPWHGEYGLVGLLSAMTVEMGSEALFKEWEAKLGPDPLREDADRESSRFELQNKHCLPIGSAKGDSSAECAHTMALQRLWMAMQRSKKPMGLAGADDASCKSLIASDSLPLQRLWAAMQTSKKPVGLALMTQEMIAGLGNIYRAEVLFKVCDFAAGAVHKPCLYLVQAHPGGQKDPVGSGDLQLISPLQGQMELA
eukprot:1161677-Pelagomonas_calceolata.AAC.5